MRDAQDLGSLWPDLGVAPRQSRLRGSLRFSSGPLAAAIESDRSVADLTASALWRRDATAWSADSATEQRILNRLGWMSAPALMAEDIANLEAFARSVTDDGCTDVVLLGMGGSSLAPEVLRSVLGVARGFPRFQMLDSTDPASVRAADTAPEHTLYVLASKSGTTIEPNSLAAHFRARLEERVTRWANHFVAITDEGTELAQRARQDGFRRVFINPSDIGGRYSALSYFGLVPAALMGQDLRALVGWGLAMLTLSEPAQADAQAGALTLGLAMGSAARSGRDKLTLLLPPRLEPFGLWIEQLVAESTGKNGVGIVPIAGEAPAPAGRYGTDRLFVRTRVAGERDPHEQLARDLEAAGAPVVDIELAEVNALGAEFVRWEFATAIAGAVLRVNPFDEPNVQAAKDATRALLDEFNASGRLPRNPAAERRPDGVVLTLTTRAREELGARSPESMLALLQPGDYFALLAYLGPDPQLAEELARFRNAVRDRTGAATMLGFGPRYLHSTGQLHKGGRNSGVFVLLSAEPTADISIPGQRFSLGTLELAQASGDLASLDKTMRRALHLHFPRPDRALLRTALASLLDGMPGGHP